MSNDAITVSGLIMSREFQNGNKVTCDRHAGVHAAKGECRNVQYVAPIVASAAPQTVLMGRCVTCKRPFRIVVPLTFKLPGRVWHSVLVASGVTPPLCDCGESGRGEVRWTPLAVEYSPDVYCGIGEGNCWSAKNSKCRCSCRGANHGGMHALIAKAA